jgi:hypothetical protein
MCPADGRRSPVRVFSLAVADRRRWHRRPMVAPVAVSEMPATTLTHVEIGPIPISLKLLRAPVRQLGLKSPPVVVRLLRWPALRHPKAT